MADVIRGMILIVLLTALPFAGTAAGNPAAEMAICRNAAIKAADRHDVPRDVLIAITLVETGTNRGGTYGAWPWTVNVAGKGYWLDSRAAALLQAQKAVARGQPSFDVGCFQLNYRWHGEHFSSIDQMFEPGPSGDYAARFLKSLHDETGDWIKAAGFYHSRTPVHAKRYRGLVARAVRKLGGQAPAVETQVAAADGTPDRILRRSGDGTFWPLRRIGQRLEPAAGSNAGSGALSLHVLRRSSGALIGPGRQGG